MIIGAIIFIINAVAYFLPLKDWVYMLYTVVNFGFWIAETTITAMIRNGNNQLTIIVTIVANETFNDLNFDPEYLIKIQKMVTDIGVTMLVMILVWIALILIYGLCAFFLY